MPVDESGMSEVERQARSWIDKLEAPNPSEAEIRDFQDWFLAHPANRAAANSILAVQVDEVLKERQAETRGLMEELRERLASFDPPGSGLAALLELLTTRRAYRRYVEPVIADMQQEYTDALKAEHLWLARWIVFRGHLLVIPGWLYALLTGKLGERLRRGR